MANDLRGDVDVVTAERIYTFRLGNNAARHLEEVLAKSLNEIAEELQSRPSITMITEIFRAGLMRHHPDLNTDAAGDIIDEIGMVRAGQIIGDGFRRMFPPAEAAAGNESRAARPRKAAVK